VSSRSGVWGGAPVEIEFHVFLTLKYVKEYHPRLPFSLFVPLSLKLGAIVKNMYLENRKSNFHQIFRVFGGPPVTSNPSKSQDLTREFSGRGWRKKFDPQSPP